MTRDDGEGGIAGGGFLVCRSMAVTEVQACAVSHAPALAQGLLKAD